MLERIGRGHRYARRLLTGPPRTTPGFFGIVSKNREITRLKAFAMVHLRDLHEDITAAVEDGRGVFRWLWYHAMAGTDLEEQAAAIVAVLKTKASFPA